VEYLTRWTHQDTYFNGLRSEAVINITGENVTSQPDLTSGRTTNTLRVYFRDYTPIYRKPEQPIEQAAIGVVEIPGWLWADYHEALNRFERLQQAMDRYDPEFRQQS
jgi:hypothetical protein